MIQGTLLLLLAAGACRQMSRPPGGWPDNGAAIFIEGTVSKTDTKPMFVDGDGLVFAQTALYGMVVVRIPARERLCRARGLDAFFGLRPGDVIRASGIVTGPRDARVCDSPDHFLEEGD
jgi:hypothetical protein